MASPRQRRFARLPMEPPGPAHSGAETAAGWSWPAVARPAAGAERLSLDFAHGCPLEGSAGTLSFLSDLSPAFSTRGAFRRDARRPGSLGLGSGSQRESSIYKKLLSTGVSPPPKKGAPSGQNQARQGDQDHGRGRRLWSSYRPMHGLCFAARGNAGKGNAGRESHQCVARAPYWRCRVRIRYSRPRIGSARRCPNRSSSP